MLSASSMDAPAALPRRPLGVTFWVLYGLLTLLAITAMHVVARLRAPELVSGWTVLPWLIILAGAVHYGRGTWRGQTHARDRFVYYLILAYGLMVLHQLRLLYLGDLPADQHGWAWMRLVRSVVMGGLVAWYFHFSDRTDAFFYPTPPDDPTDDA